MTDRLTDEAAFVADAAWDAVKHGDIPDPTGWLSCIECGELTPKPPLCTDCVTVFDRSREDYEDSEVREVRYRAVRWLRAHGRTDD